MKDGSVVWRTHINIEIHPNFCRDIISYVNPKEILWFLQKEYMSYLCREIIPYIDPVEYIHQVCNTKTKSSESSDSFVVYAVYFGHDQLKWQKVSLKYV